MTRLDVLLYPISFTLEGGPPRLVSLGHADGSPLSRSASEGGPDVTVRSLLRDTVEELLVGQPDTAGSGQDEFRQLAGRFLDLAGVDRHEGHVRLVYTAIIPAPFAEKEFAIGSESAYGWRTINESRAGRASLRTPTPRRGPEAIVLDHCRQAMEETDIALDFLGEFVSLHQLRSLYDAVWGYAQDPSGFKRWAIDRPGAFQDLLVEVRGAGDVDEAFYQSLGRRLTPDLAARAGAAASAGLTGGVATSLALPLAVTAATTVNRLYKHRGPEPKWFAKSTSWRPGPTWIQNVYPPRPNWTRWETHQGGSRESAVAT